MRQIKSAALSMAVLLSAVGLGLAWPSLALADIPLMINHQGLVKVDGEPFGGQTGANGLFKFGFLDSATSTWLWTNDGSHVGESASTLPDVAVTIPVNYGVYNVRLGDTTLAGMTAIPSSVFESDDVKLRVIFDDQVNGEEILSPDQPITSVAYAYHAARADNAIPSIFRTFGGDGSDSDVTVSSSASFSSLTGGQLYLQANDFTVESGATLTIDTGWAYIGVKGTCTIQGTIDADEQGVEGGDGATTNLQVGGMGLRADGYGSSSQNINQGDDLSGSEPRIDSVNALQQLAVDLAITGAGGGGGGGKGEFRSAGGAGGGAGSHGGQGGTEAINGGQGSPGQDGNATPSAKLMLLAGGFGEGPAEGGAPFLPQVFRFRGGGGGGGGRGHSSIEYGGVGGKGGGVIYLECKELVFSGTLTAIGGNGGFPPPNYGGGGGGGGGGIVLVRANMVTVNTGTLMAAGGTGAVGGPNNPEGAGGDGADGFKDIIQVK